MVRFAAAIVAASGLGVKTAVFEPEAQPREAEFLGEYSPNERPWEVHRSQADSVGEIYRLGGEEFARLSYRIADCSQILDYAWVEDRKTSETGELRFKLKAARFCRVRTCPVCQWRRSLMWFGRFVKALDKVLDVNPSMSLIFMTITVRNCQIDDLRVTLRDMVTAWRRFVVRKEFANIQGWVRTTEITYGVGGTAHPHFHVLLLVRNSWFNKSFVSQARWQQSWRESARLDYPPQLRVNKVRRKRGQDFKRAAAETLKYAVKPEDAISNPEWFRELTRQIRQLRFIASGGVFKDAFREEDETQQDLLLVDEEKPEEKEHGRVAFNWEKPIQHYRRMKESGRIDCMKSDRNSKRSWHRKDWVIAKSPL